MKPHIAIMQDAELQPVTIADRWPRRFRQQLQQCQMLIGDAEGPKGQCQEIRLTTAYWHGQQLKVCEHHKQMCKREQHAEALREQQEAMNA